MSAQVLSAKVPDHGFSCTVSKYNDNCKCFQL